ncbi:MAG: hypothetical protein ACKV2T_32705 [Kofleriaceae bacterium]
MSGRPAIDVASVPRVLVLDGERTRDVFVVLDLTEGVVRVRSPLLFEIGEEIAIRIEQNGTTSDVTARVRAHVGTGADPVTELELISTSSSA